MANTWKNIVKRVTSSTSKTFDKGKDIVTIKKHKNAIANYYRDIGELIYVLYRDGEKNVSLNEKKVKTILEDIDYHFKKVDSIQ